MKIRFLALVILLLSAVSSLHAQWLKYPSPGMPRKADGSPDLTARAPRTADGKPDFSGVWGFDAGPSLFYALGDLKPDEIQPWAVEAAQKQAETLFRDDAPGCSPEGPRFNHFLALPNKIVQTPNVMIVMSENLTFRQIFLDGRPLPEIATLSLMGYSTGRWEGDTLVVETIGYKDRTKLDLAGFPHSEDLRLTERYRRMDVGHMEIQETFSDPAVYKRPFTVTVKATLVPDTELLEYVCAENEQDAKGGHLVGTASENMKSVKPVKLAPEILARYVGTYDFRWPENPTIPSLWKVTMNNGELSLQGGPLIPLSETRFMWGGGQQIEFFRDAQGRVTHFGGEFVEGQLIAKRMPDSK